MSDVTKKSDGRFVLMCFIAFFGIIVAVNSIFIYNALDSYSGVVTEQPYEKGLAYNETLEKAKAQPDLEHKASYKDATLRWALPIENASVTAILMRPVQEGYDFEIKLKHMGGGVYEAEPAMPLLGAWTAKLKATWNNKEFQTNLPFIAK